VAIELVLTIEQAVSSWYREELKWQEPRVSFRRLSQNPLGWAGVLQFHRIYMITANDEATTSRQDEAVLKIYRREENARQDFDYLVKLSAGFKKLDQGFGVPVPLAVLPGIRGLLTSMMPGKRLDAILWPSPFAKDRNKYSTVALDAIRRAASWLALYQTITPHEDPHNLKGEMLIEEIRANLDLCGKRGLSPLLVEGIASWVSEVEHGVKGMRSECVNTCHLQPNHMLISEEETSAIDFEDAGCGWPSSDLAAFLAYCGVYKKTFYSMSISFEVLCENFLQTYSSRKKLGTNHWTLLEISYIQELLNAFLAPSIFAAKHLSWRISGSPILLTRWFSWNYWLSWISYLAKREIAKRTAKGNWQTLLKEWDASKSLMRISEA
jgi:hypothetical protein